MSKNCPCFLLDILTSALIYRAKEEVKRVSAVAGILLCSPDLKHVGAHLDSDRVLGTDAQQRLEVL